MELDQITIGNRVVGKSCLPFLIAEVGLAHEGSLGVAHRFIDSVADTGCEAIKFQTHIAEEESTAREVFRVPVFPQDATRFDYWKRTAFEKSQWLELASHAKERNITFLSSAFSNMAVDWLMECGVPAWKVASGELTNTPLLQQMAETGLPLLLSSGMSAIDELDRSVELVRSFNAPCGVFQCTTAYPCPPNTWGLNLIGDFADRFRCPVGLSDHSGSIVPGIAAVSLGASMLEFHVTYDRRQFGPDVPASLTLEQTSELVAGIKQLHEALSSPVDKNKMAENLEELHSMFSKSVVASRALSCGHCIERTDLAFKKPGTGISANDYEKLIGKRLVRDVEVDHFFASDDMVADDMVADDMVADDE